MSEHVQSKALNTWHEISIFGIFLFNECVKGHLLLIVNHFAKFFSDGEQRQMGFSAQLVSRSNLSNLVFGSISYGHSNVLFWQAPGEPSRCYCRSSLPLQQQSQ